MAIAKTHLKTKGVGIADLDAFRRDLQRLAREGGPTGLSLLKAANHRVAEHIRTRAVTRAGTVGPQQAKAASTLRSSRAATSARLTLGSAAVPWAQGAEFGAMPNAMRFNIGGRPPRSGLGWNQFRDGGGSQLEWKEPGYGQTGYFLFPTMRAESERIKDMYVRELDDICKIAFPDGRL